MTICSCIMIHARSLSQISKQLIKHAKYSQTNTIAMVLRLFENMHGNCLIKINIAARHPWLSGHVNPGRSSGWCGRACIIRFFWSNDPGRSMACVALLIWSAPFISRGGWEVVLHVREGQNHLFTSHFLHLHCGEDGAGGVWRPLLRRRVRGLFRRRWSWRGRLLAVEREGHGWLHLSLSRPSSPSPSHVSSSNPSRR
jgi:hypothetical protein